MLVIYSTKTCAWCVQVERYFQLKKVIYSKVFVDDDLPLRERLLAITGKTSVPVTSDGKTYVTGWDVRALNDLISQQI